MKQILLLMAVIGLTQFSCTKSADCHIDKPTTLEGKWRMISSEDNLAGSLVTKPSSISGDVDIDFMSATLTAGTFDGNTPTNQIFDNDYMVGTDQSMTITDLKITKVEETSWGSEFVDNIRSSQSYSFEAHGRLIIVTTGKTLTFERL